MPWARTSCDQDVEKSSMVPSSGSIAVCPPSRLPMAHGLPGSPRPRRKGVVAALAVGVADRVDGGRYSTSKPMAATSAPGRRSPCKPPNDRGNSSYQAPTSARSRSTHSGAAPSAVRSAAPHAAPRAAATSGVPSAALRRAAVVERRRSGGQCGRGRHRHRPARRHRRPAPRAAAMALGDLDADRPGRRASLTSDLVGPGGVAVGPRLHDQRSTGRSAGAPRRPPSRRCRAGASAASGRPGRWPLR